MEIDFKKLPEYKRLRNALNRVDAFREKHKERVKCKGCKACLDHRDIVNVFVKNSPPEYSKLDDNCSHERVLDEKLSEEDKKINEELYKKLGEAYVAYRNKVR